jgi:hypothetical protein
VGSELAITGVVVLYLALAGLRLPVMRRGWPKGCCFGG